jgi:2'-5' RNA ligase
MRGTRTFIALPLPPTLAKACLAWMGELKARGVDARWATEEELHITLAFLGELKTTEVVEVCRQTTRVAASSESFVLGLEGIGFFPSARRPRILWAGLDRGNRETCDLQERLSEILVREHLYRADERPFHPHVTLGRLNESTDLNPEMLQQDFRNHKSPVGRIDTCLVMESVPGTMPRYATMATCPLTPAPGKSK